MTPALIERGKALYGRSPAVHVMLWICAAAIFGGPNLLLRSQLVLNDQAGEAIDL